MSTKPQLREQARARRAELARALPNVAARLASFADELDLPPGAVVAGTWPIRDEADPQLLMAALAAKGHRLALPRLAAKDAALAFHHWSQNHPTQVSVFGIAEPLAHAEPVAPSVLLVPLLAFDAQGFRLGYGGGYYDRTLAALRAEGEVLAIGVAYAGQEVEKLPRGPHDQRLDMLISERGVRRFTR